MAGNDKFNGILKEGGTYLDTILSIISSESGLDNLEQIGSRAILGLNGDSSIIQFMPVLEGMARDGWKLSVSQAEGDIAPYVDADNKEIAVGINAQRGHDVVTDHIENFQEINPELVPENLDDFSEQHIAAQGINLGEALSDATNEYLINAFMEMDNLSQEEARQAVFKLESGDDLPDVDGVSFGRSSNDYYDFLKAKTESLLKEMNIDPSTTTAINNNGDKQHLMRELSDELKADANGLHVNFDDLTADQQAAVGNAALQLLEINGVDLSGDISEQLRDAQTQLLNSVIRYEVAAEVR